MGWNHTTYVYLFWSGSNDFLSEFWSKTSLQAGYLDVDSYNFYWIDEIITSVDLLQTQHILYVEKRAESAQGRVGVWWIWKKCPFKEMSGQIKWKKPAKLEWHSTDLRILSWFFFQMNSNDKDQWYLWTLSHEITKRFRPISAEIENKKQTVV